MFKKKDLRNGMIVELNNGHKYMVLDELLVNLKGFMPLRRYNDNLIVDSDNRGFDVYAVYRADTFGIGLGVLLSEKSDRGLVHIATLSDIEEMTLEEVCQALGKRIKIVPN